MATLSISRRALMSGAAALAGITTLPFPAPALAQKAGGRLVVAADSEPRNLNPAIIASNGVFFIASKVIEPLAEASFEGLVPRLATAWKGSPDGLSVTLTLREGVKWHDGKPFTSEDVAFSALKVWKPLQNLGRIVFKDLASVDTPDARTAVLKFSKPTPIQLIENALPALTAVIPKHVYDVADINANPANVNLIGTGPYKFTEYKAGQYFRLTKNADYWDKGKPLLDEIVYQVLPDRAAAASALEAGQIQLAAFSMVPLADLARIGKVQGLQVVSKGYESLTYQLIVEINHRTKQLADVKVRRAISHAIDRDFVVKTVFLGYGRASTGPVPTTSKTFYNPNVPAYPFDVAKANALLDEAGYPRGANGVRFGLNLLPAPYFNETKQFGDYFRQALAAVGIDAKIVNNDSAAHQKAVYTDHNFDIAIGPPVFRDDPAISTTILFRSGTPAGVPFSQQGGYANKDVDALIDKAAETLDPKARTELYNQLQKLVVEDLPIINVAEWGFTSVASTKVGAIANNPRWPVSNWADTYLDA